MNKIAFFDVDGTLLDVPNGLTKPTNKTVEALKKFQSDGNYIVVASARGKIPNSLKVINFDGFIGCDGHYICFKDKVLVDDIFQYDDLIKLIDIFNKHDGHYIMSGHYGEWYEDVNNPLIKKHLMLYQGTNKVTGDNIFDLHDIKVNVVTAIFNNKEDLYNAIEQLDNDLVISAYDKDHIRMDIYKEGFTKGTGCQFLSQYLKIDKENTYAFGDGLNDKQMLKLVGTGVAMANAVPELKEYCDEVTTSVLEDGIYNYFIKHII